MANSEPSWDRDADVESLCLIRSTFSGYIPVADTPVEERPLQGRVTNQLTNGLQPPWSAGFSERASARPVLEAFNTLARPERIVYNRPVLWQLGVGGWEGKALP